MKIIFTDHARERVRERQILVKDIKEAIKSPTSRLVSLPQSKSRKLLVEKH